jgi:YebC/PmpR family DNA-binding regulatory protein
MSGHSKFANIKHKKGKTDAQRGKLFTKLGREIAVAVKAGGPNPESNARLADVVAKAKASNMPMDSIQRSVKKAAGGEDGTFEEISYEGYGPGGIAVIVEAATDNKNRTAAEVRNYFDKYGGNLGTTGCVSFLFEKKGVIVLERTAKTSEDAVMMEALDAGADDFSAGDGYFEVLTPQADFSKVRAAMEAKGYALLEASVQMVPSNTVKLTDPKQEEQMAKIIDFLEDLDDVQNVWHNWERPEPEEED